MAPVSVCSAELLGPGPSARATCPGAPATAVQGQVCPCRHLAQPGSPQFTAGVHFPSPARESSPPGLPLLGRRPVPAPGRAASRADVVCGPGRGRAPGDGAEVEAHLRAGLQPASPTPLSLPRDPGAAFLSLSRSLRYRSAAWALLSQLRASGCNAQLLVESGKGSDSSEGASVSLLSISAPDTQLFLHHVLNRLFFQWSVVGTIVENCL
ncbi:uncharacterized protein [Vicugna pacos]|uniref:Uncharacterized protein isoform X2 n=1 Tax=Vicugna pacos TaxID=30538 RepID=A0ABM5C8S3_VICPA